MQGVHGRSDVRRDCPDKQGQGHHGTDWTCWGRLPAADGCLPQGQCQSLLPTARAVKSWGTGRRGPILLYPFLPWEFVSLPACFIVSYYSLSWLTERKKQHVTHNFLCSVRSTKGASFIVTVLSEIKSMYKGDRFYWLTKKKDKKEKRSERNVTKCRSCTVHMTNLLT